MEVDSLAKQVSEMKRECMYCGANLTACFGHVLARDILPILEDDIMPYKIREVCGMCILLVDIGRLPRPALDEVSLEYEIDWDLVWLEAEIHLKQRALAA